MSRSDFWNDQENANKIIKELKVLKGSVDLFVRLEKEAVGLREIAEIAEPHETESITSFMKEMEALAKKVSNLEFLTLLGGEDDCRDAIMSVNAGAGGTESCDWAGMLLRMYTKWAESKGYDVQKVDSLSGEEAGIKNATVIIKGDFAYGYLKGESGVHRLVRISPFDSNKRRHTSFASIDIIPDIGDDISIDIKESDLKIDTFRSGGKGGQHVNVTDSAVRITHIPTGMIAQCQNERSQFKNKAMALKLLKAKLYEQERSKRNKKVVAAYESKKEIAWGSQIRSYVLHPYSMVKDHRTEYETSNAHGVLDGELDRFIEAYLKNEKRTS